MRETHIREPARIRSSFSEPVLLPQQPAAVKSVKPFADTERSRENLADFEKKFSQKSKNVPGRDT